MHASSAPHATDAHTPARSTAADKALIGRKHLTKGLGEKEKARFMRDHCVKTIIIALQCRPYQRVTTSSRKRR
ncbi:hypothetical protein [Caballeronia ptereochthonis]|uniref:hypothetical protein n=1 Tax=Caballeronia ptereochthonis TaxID=1777144 RepID=UPI00142D9722|nr:hypothetical protein [Caballeronia ptereochthonis]